MSKHKLQRFKCEWAKTYIMSGTVTVEAGSDEQAVEIVDTIVGDLTGSMRYDPDLNTYDIIEVSNEEI